MSTGESKACTKCGEVKPLDAFPQNGRGGHRADCKVCHATHVKARYHANLEESQRTHRERTAADYARDPQKYRDRAKVFRDRHPDRHLAWSLAWAAANVEKVRGYQRKWDAAHPEKKRDQVRKRRAMRLAAFVAEVEFNHILQRDLGVCGICAKPVMEETVELDHIVPLAAGGTHEPDNVQLAHRTCNRRKHAKVGFTLAA